MKRSSATFAFLLGAGLCSSAFAADYTWLGKTANWLDALNWSAGGAEVDWANDNKAVFEAGGPNLDINVSGAVAPNQMVIRDNYTFSGTGSITLNGYGYVAEGKTATYDGVFKQTSSDTNYRFIKGAVGTLALKGKAAAYRAQVDTGTLRLKENATFTLSGTSSAASNSGAVLGLSGGDLVLEKSSTLQLTSTSSYIPNSGSGVTISGGTFDASKVSEFLNGFNDNNKTDGKMKSKRAFVTVENGGKLLAKTIRLSKATETEITTNPEYARLNLNTNGLVSANNIYIESTSYHGVINFNGGVLEHTPAQSQIDAKTHAMISHANMALNVKEGGAHIKLVNGSLNRTFATPFVSAADKDGGLTIEGDGGVAYMNPTNTFNGPTTLTGTGGLIYVPKFDRSLGLEPAVPTDNIIFKTGNPILHSDYTWTVHSNRNVRIEKDVIARIGNGGHLSFAGAIRGEEGATSNSAVKVLNNWGGSLTLVPVPGRENEFGRLITEGHTVIGAGMTKLTSRTSGTHSSAVIYACGDGKAWGWKGTLDVTNGTLKVTDTSHQAYLETAKWGRIRVTGGTFDCIESKELLNALDGPGRVEVSGTGTINAYIVRISQTTTMEDALPAACVYLGKGGTFKFHHFSIDANAKPKGRVDFDGGKIVARSARENMFGTGAGSWTNILFRVCKGGLVIDTNGQQIGIVPPLLTGVAEGKDGGLTKKGSNVLYVRNPANTYTGPTRTDKGQLIFEATSGASPVMPGDLEISVAELAKLTASERNGTYVQTLTVSADMKVRVVDVPDGFDAKSFGKIGILRTMTPMTKIPDVVLIDADGNERSSADWRVSLSADRKTLSFGAAKGCVILLR